MQDALQVPLVPFGFHYITKKLDETVGPFAGESIFQGLPSPTNFTNQNPFAQDSKMLSAKPARAEGNLRLSGLTTKKTQQVATEIFTRVIIRLSGFVMERLDYKKRVFLQEDSQT